MFWHSRLQLRSVQYLLFFDFHFVNFHSCVRILTGTTSKQPNNRSEIGFSSLSFFLPEINRTLNTFCIFGLYLISICYQNHVSFFNFLHIAVVFRFVCIPSIETETKTNKYSSLFIPLTGHSMKPIMILVFIFIFIFIPFVLSSIPSTYSAG